MKRTLETINKNIVAASQKRSIEIKRDCPEHVPCLVAVSKLQPISSIIEAYQCGQRHFGENYFQELLEKSNSPQIIEQCPDIKFHLIGHLQSNKVNKLPKIKNLHMIQSVDSIKLADMIHRAFERAANGEIDNNNSDTGQPNHSTDNSSPNLPEQVNIMIQVNTSGEDQKSGILPEDAPKLARHIETNCRKLKLVGLMTIGKLMGWADQENQDYVRLFQTRSRVAEELSTSPCKLELSMGMSGDYEDAVTYGSSIVRVGTLIFGERNK